MPTIRLVPSTYALSNTALTITDVDNMYTNTDSTTYGRVGTTSNSTRYLYLRGFNFGSLPVGAEVSSFTIKIKANESSLTTSNTYRPYLVNNTTTITGTFSAINTTVTTQSCTGVTATWATISGYGANFGIRFTVRSSSNNTQGYLNVYGAEIEVNYEVPVYHQITASSAVPGVSVTPASQSLREGSNTTITFDIDDITGYIVTDNDVDVTDSLVRHEKENTGSVSRTADSFTTGFSGGTSMNFYMSSSSTGNNFQYAVGHTAESPGSTSSGSGSWTYVKSNGGSTTETGYADYVFDFSSIPEGAVIESVDVKCYGAVESASQSTSHSDITLFSGNTQKGTMQKFTSSTNSIITISAPGTWTRAELQSAKLRFAVGYYGGHLFGITWNVTYSIELDEHYYTYTLSNITASHVILLDEEEIIIPPDEDPDETYWPITISSINANTDPGQGTTRVVEGTTQVITITPTDPQLTLALDNGVDITNQLVGGVPVNTYTITTQVTGASYGFNLNSSTGYYVSTNNGVAKSASVARLNMDFESSCLVTIQYINYAEANYDYGMFGKLDTTVATDGLTANSQAGTSSPSDSTSNYQLAMCSNSANAQTITYEVPAGQHYIDIKYGKDDATNSNNDSLQWKVLSVEATGSGSSSYTYTLTNITQKHSLIFVFGDVTFYYVTSSGSAGMKLFPDGQQVVLDGDNYRLVAIPENYDDIVQLFDNNVEVTSSLTVEQGEDKSGNPVINYIYKLNEISANHNLVFYATSPAAPEKFFIKRSGSWIEVSRIYLKVSGQWQEQRLDYLSDLGITKLIQG